MRKESYKEFLMILSIVFFTKYGLTPASIAFDIAGDIFAGRGYSTGREFIVLIVWAPVSLLFLGSYFLIKKTEIVGIIVSIALFAIAILYETFFAF